jgi:hypothetical protein
MNRRPLAEWQRLVDLTLASQADQQRRQEVEAMSRFLQVSIAQEAADMRHKLAAEATRALKATLRDLITDRFGGVPEALGQRIEAATDPLRLNACIRQVLRVGAVEELEI